MHPRGNPRSSRTRVKSSNLEVTQTLCYRYRWIASTRTSLLQDPRTTPARSGIFRRRSASTRSNTIKIEFPRWSGAPLNRPSFVRVALTRPLKFWILDTPTIRLYRRCNLLNRNCSINCRLCWNPNNPSQIAYTTEEGNLCLFDAKMPGKHIFDVRAHAQSATGVKIGSRNFTATCSEDGLVKVWDLFDLEDGKPRLLHAQNPKCVLL